uniref:Uncharacterized protein n=1 Tax=Oryza barthii TaxID=65489 RepID=A0A0D3HPZ2_9ORYZ
MGSAITVLGWLLSPIISLLVNRFISYLFDASPKIQELEIQTVPKLEQMLRKIEEERMHRKAKKERSAVQNLDTLAKLVKSALYEAEDILDLIGYHQIEKDVIGDDEPQGSSSKWHPHIDEAIHACKTSWIGRCITTLLEWAQSLYRSLRSRSAALLPISCSRCCGSASDSLLERLSCLSGQFDFIRCCQSLFIWSVNWFEVARSYRDWFYDATGITATGYQTSSGAWNDIVNMNRRSITSSSTRKVFGRDRERDMIRSMLREDDSLPSSSSRKCYFVICIYGIPGSGKTTLAQLEDIFRDMLEEITQSRHSEISDCRGLEAKLVENLRGKRFLLVLDDLWVNDENHEKLLSPLNVGKSGSRILVTAQSKEAALGSNRLIPISDLEEEQYFSMFMHYALDSTIFDDREYIPIGRKIAKKLNRSPIAAVTVAGQLWRNPDIRFWQTTANLDVLNKTKGALWWSYNQLVVDVRRCFQYCSIFPRRYELERDNLVRTWIAQGFVKDNDGNNEDVEDVGQDYFHDLHSCSFLQLKRKAPSDISTGEYFTVHDMFHELAKTIAGSDCVKIEKSITEHLPKHVRHLCIESYSEILFPEKILELKNLRTLIMCYSVKGMNQDDFERVLKKLTKLRVVHLDLRHLSRVPPCIGGLKHLRYLGIMSPPPHSLILPAEFSKLYHLQELSVHPNTRLHCPSQLKIANLINLRYMLTWYGLNIPDVGKLTSLRALYHFYSKEEAVRARLSDKVYLTELTLRWGGTDERCSKKALESYKRLFFPPVTEIKQHQPPELQEEVLEGLRPPSGITVLCIRDYGGVIYPSWLTGDGCDKEQEQDRPALQNLMFWSCKGSSDPPKIGEFFTCLHTLSVTDCSWNYLPVKLCRLKTLRELIVQECPNMMTLPKLPQSLKSIVISGCLPSLADTCLTPGHPNWRRIKHIDQQIIR